MLTRANFSMENVNHVVKSYYREEDIRQQNVSQSTLYVLHDTPKR